MEWNWFVNGNNPIPLLLSESTGDSEEVKSDVYNDHEAAMDEHDEGVLFRFHDEDDVVDDVDDDDDDDAQSCSYDHSPYINTRSCGNSQHDQSQRLIYDDDDDGEIDDDIDDDDDDDKNKNQCQTKWMDSSKQRCRSHKSCVDPLNQREIDRKFWETCLAS